MTTTTPVPGQPTVTKGGKVNGQEQGATLEEKVKGDTNTNVTNTGMPNAAGPGDHGRTAASPSVAGSSGSTRSGQNTLNEIANRIYPHTALPKGLAERET